MPRNNCPLARGEDDDFDAVGGVEDKVRVAFLPALLIAFAASANAQPPLTPRTADGHPDFQGVWETNMLATTERLPDATGLVVSEAEARKLVDAFWAKRFEGLYDPNENLGLGRDLSRVNGELRSGLVTDPPDGRVPLTEEGRKLVAAETAMINSTTPDGYETRKWQERCLAGPGRPPMPAGATDNLRRIVQTPGYLMIHTETDGGETRIIGIDAAHGPAAITSFLGDSVARWEGEVLVIETTSMRGEQALRGGAILTRPGARIIERLSFFSPHEVLYRFTVEDPVVYSRPWSAEYSFYRSQAPIFEWACSEGNYSLTNILRAAREAEKHVDAGKPNVRP